MPAVAQKRKRFYRSDAYQGVLVVVTTIETEIADWGLLVEEIARTKKAIVQRLGVGMVHFIPHSSPKKSPAQKAFSLCCLALIHGVEVAGIAVQNEVFRRILSGQVQLHVDVVFGLGNIEAARRGVRFIDRDLNRSFPMGEAVFSKGIEGLRAQELAAILDDTSFLIDLHQTREKVETPFFIFPFHREGYQWALNLNLSLPIVTHWGSSFSKDGCSSDEYILKKGGAGVTLELGQNGFVTESIDTGVMAISRALNLLARSQVHPAEKGPIGFDASTQAPQLYTWARTVYNDHPERKLIEGLTNFKAIKADEVLYTEGGKPCVAGEEGVILFPQYPASDGVVRSSELCRIAKRIREEDLPLSSNGG